MVGRVCMVFFDGYRDQSWEVGVVVGMVFNFFFLGEEDFVFQVGFYEVVFEIRV